MEYLYAGLGLLGLLILIILIRTFTFSENIKYEKNEHQEIDDKVVEELCTLLKYKTISYEDKSEIDFSVFQEYINKVKELYPLVFSKCEFTQTKEYAIVLKLSGKSSEKPTVFLSHYDVVPVTEGWKHDPFLGEVVDGAVYGRGALDTKCTMVFALRALENALKNNYVPQNDLYLCFGSNEEVYGDAQAKVVESFKEKGIKPALVFDEGGGITSNAFPGVKEDTAFLGVVEKGMVNVKLSIDGNGGHSSTPRKNGPTIQLTKALLRLEKHPMKPQFIKATKELVNKMGRHSSFGLRLVLANMWLFKGLVKKLFTIASADTRALLTTTFAFTLIHGGTASNVIPNHVEANINIRIAPFNTLEEVMNHIRKVIKNDNIKIEYSDANKMYKECDFNTEGYKKIEQTIYKTYDNVVAAPFIMLGGTDARHYNEISDCVIRFSPVKVTNEERKGVHGLDEQLSVSAVKKGLEFYQNLLEII